MSDMIEVFKDPSFIQHLRIHAQLEKMNEYQSLDMTFKLQSGKPFLDSLLKDFVSLIFFL